jgi:site-specific recombinase XerD
MNPIYTLEPYRNWQKGYIYWEIVEAYLDVMRSRNLSHRTLETYTDSLNRFHTYLQLRGQVPPLTDITAQDITDFINHVLNTPHHFTGKPIQPATAHNRFRALRSFFTWCVNIDILYRSPMAKLKAPKVPIQPVPILTRHELVTLLAVCMGSDLKSRRDLAMFLVLYDTGARRAELLSMSISNLNLEKRTARVMGKGGRTRDIYFGQATAQALQLYIERRDRGDYYFECDALWIGRRGPMTGQGLSITITKRAEEAHIPRVFAHQFRHSFAHNFLINGGQETDLCTILGWDSPAPVMLRRYAASASRVRAKAAHDRFGPGDRL